MDPRIFETEPDGVLIGLRRLPAGDVDRITRSAERRDELLERSIEVRGESHQRQTVVHDRVGQQHARFTRFQIKGPAMQKPSTMNLSIPR